MEYMLRLLTVCSGAYTLERLRNPPQGCFVMIAGLQAKFECGISRMQSRHLVFSTVM